MTRTCLVCGRTGEDVQMGLGRYLDGVVAALWRCRDRIACRARLEAAGGAWDLDDAWAPGPTGGGLSGADARR